MTREVVFAGQALKIRVQDHLIIGDERYYSFAEQKQIKKFDKQMATLYQHKIRRRLIWPAITILLLQNF